jgi:hypothetical protein
MTIFCSANEIKITSHLFLRKKIGFPVPLDSIFSNKSKEESVMDAWLVFNLSILME